MDFTAICELGLITAPGLMVLSLAMNEASTQGTDLILEIADCIVILTVAIASSIILHFYGYEPLLILIKIVWWTFCVFGLYGAALDCFANGALVHDIIAGFVLRVEEGAIYIFERCFGERGEGRDRYHVRFARQSFAA